MKEMSANGLVLLRKRSKDILHHIVNHNKSQTRFDCDACSASLMVVAMTGRVQTCDAIKCYKKGTRLSNWRILLMCCLIVSTVHYFQLCCWCGRGCSPAAEEKNVCSHVATKKCWAAAAEPEAESEDWHNIFEPIILLVKTHSCIIWVRKCFAVFTFRWI